jgi:uncharacterized membrane protein
MAVLDLGHTFIAKPNNSLSPMGSVYLLVAISAVSLMIAIGFALMGAWLVMPFAGLELLALVYAFNYVYLHSNDFERITIDSDRVIVEKSVDRQITQAVFQRYWANVGLRSFDENRFSAGKMGLFIGSHGKEVEFGRHLINDEQRILLAQLIKQKLKHID